MVRVIDRIIHVSIVDQLWNGAAAVLVIQQLFRVVNGRQADAVVVEGHLQNVRRRRALLHLELASEVPHERILVGLLLGIQRTGRWLNGTCLLVGQVLQLQVFGAVLLHGDSLEFVGQARVVEGDLWWVLEFYLLLVQQFYL